jgi:hypothetical protein
MICASKDRFAIESEITGEYPEHVSWVFGLVCFWMGGERIGNFTQALMLSVPVSGLDYLLDHRGKLDASELCNIPKEQVFHLIRTSLYNVNGEDKDMRELVRLENMYRRYVLCPGLCEAFDGDTVIVLECEDNVRIVWKAYESSATNEVHLERILNFLAEN